MKGIFGSALVAMALSLASGAVLADTITLPTVTVVGISNDGARLACTGYECASFLESIGGIATSFHSPVTGMGEGGVSPATRELIEIYTHHMKQPAAAAPLLARLVDRHPHSPAAEWAKRELALLRAELHQGTPSRPDPAD